MQRCVTCLTRWQKNIGIEIESSESKNSKVSEEIIFLDADRKAIKHFTVLWELLIDKSDDIIVVEKPIFEIWI